ncbi:MAG TPA: M14 family metallopeptidase [Candidatus Limnocylindrales bacterium]|jgi:murein tripeptide amidase MpaA
MKTVTKLGARLALPLIAAATLLTATGPQVAAADPTDFPAGYTGYHTYAEMTADLQSVAAKYGAGTAKNITRLRNIGDSFEGRPIWSLKISDHPNQDENEPEILIECNMHAREHLTAEQCLYFVHLLTDNYKKSTALGKRVTRIVNTHEFFIIPMLNPDGAMYDISDGVFHGWRKNRQTFSYSDKVGIDPNRNWSYMWGCCGGSSAKPGSARYRGAYPFESVEDQVLRDFIQSRVVNGVQQIKEILNVHSYGEHVLYPYGYTHATTDANMTLDDHNAFLAMAQKMASLNGYKAMQGSKMYIYDGDFIDWAWATQHIFAFTWELYPKWGCGCGGFHPPDSSIQAQTSRNLDAALYLFEQADCPYREAGLTSYCSVP